MNIKDKPVIQDPYDYNDDSNYSGNTVLTYGSPWKTYGLSYSYRPSQPFRLCVSSFLPEDNNKVKSVLFLGGNNTGRC
jgi:hypothetical protein